MAAFQSKIRGAVVTVGLPKEKLVATPQQQSAADPKKSVWVSANAGSGKTHVLVERVVRLLLSGAEPASILCITYTKAAAAEMAGRLFMRLGEWTSLSDESLSKSLIAMDEDGSNRNLLSRARRLFTAALETPGGLKIQTIHAFCERLLHLFPVEAGLAPGFRVLDDRSADELQERATAAVLNSAEQTEDSDLAAAFANLSDRLNKEQFDNLMEVYVSRLVKLGPDLASLDGELYTIAVKHALGLGLLTTPEAAHAELIALDREAFARHAHIMKPYGKHGTLHVPNLLNDIATVHDPLPTLLKYFTKNDGKELRAEASLASKSAKSAHPQTEQFLVQQQALFWQRLMARNTQDIIACSAHAFTLAKAILSRIEEEKRRTGQYDFADLINRTARLLSNRNATQWVLYKLDSGLTHILLDEAQDTGRDQWRIVDALAQEFFAGNGTPRQDPRTLFVVGDQKQSIYSFQGADAAAYDGARQKYTKISELLQEEKLGISYRSTQPILDAVNKVFSDAGLARSGIETLNSNPHSSARYGQEGIFEIWPLVEFDEDAPSDPWVKPIDRPPQASPKRQLARNIAQKIKAWLNPENPRKLASSDRTVLADDVLILFRRRNDIFRMVLAELRSAQVPVSGADRLSLLNSLIVKDLLMLLQALLLPQDDYALAVILKSPLVPEPLGEEELFANAYNRHKPLGEIIGGENAVWFASLRKFATQAGPHAVLSEVLNSKRRAIMARLDVEAIEASDALLDYALDYEAEHGPSIFGFLRWFEATDTVLKREMEKGSGAVRLMTVHGAKGLEAPIVILADAAFVPKTNVSMPAVVHVPMEEQAPGLPIWVVSDAKPHIEILEKWKQTTDDLQEAESMRLLYVAMTRAADELYISGIAPKKGEVKHNSWWRIITDAVGPLAADGSLHCGSADVWLLPNKNALAQKMETPPWLDQPAPSEKLSLSLAVTALSRGPKGYNAIAARHGRAAHKLLEELADANPLERADLALARAQRLGLTKAEAAHLADVISQTDVAPFLGPQSRGESDIAGKLPNGRSITGRLDRLKVTNAGIWLLDYKTDRSVSESKTAYVQQMAAYVHLLRAAFPGRPVTAALLWTQSGNLEILSETLLTAAMQDVERAEA